MIFFYNYFVIYNKQLNYSDKQNKY